MWVLRHRKLLATRDMICVQSELELELSSLCVHSELELSSLVIARKDLEVPSPPRSTVVCV